MKYDDIDKSIRESVKCEANKYNAPDNMKENIIKQIDDIAYEEAIGMKKFNIKKTAIVLVFAVMVTGIIGFAASKVTSYITHTVSQYSKFEELEEAEKNADMDVEAVKNFSNGYSFENIEIRETEAQDKEDNEVATYKSLSIRYKNGDNWILLNITKNEYFYDDLENKKTEVFKEDGRTYYYKELQNVSVPLDYQPTKEEIKAMEEGTLNMGTSEDIHERIDEGTAKSLFWVEGKNTYHMFTMKNDINAKEMIRMAAETTNN